DGDGAPAGAPRLPGVEARPDVRASAPGGVRGPDAGEADQGATAEGTPAGAGRRRAGVRRGSQGSHSGGAGVKKQKRLSEVVGRRGTREESPSDRAVALEGHSARRGEPGRKIPFGALGSLAGGRFLATDVTARHITPAVLGPLASLPWVA